MTRMVLLTFAFLGWAWYEMSGGPDFQAGQNGVTLLARVGTTQDIEAADTQSAAVARSDTSAAELTAVLAPELALPVVRPARIEADAEKLATLTDATIRTDAVEDVAVTGSSLNEAKVFEAVSIDYRSVTGNRVNLRYGPGTDFEVVTQLIRGDEVEVLADQGDGWVKLRALDGNDIGWMSANFLVASE